MSIGLTIHAADGEIESSCYAQEVAAASFEGFFDIMQAEGVSDFGQYLSDGEGDWGAEIAKLPDPSNPKPEEIAAIEAKLSGGFPAKEVLAEAEKAFAAMQAMDESEFPNGKAELLSDFEEEVLPALREAAENDYEIELTIA